MIECEEKANKEAHINWYPGKCIALELNLIVRCYYFLFNSVKFL